jgi:hypothetical protein
MDWDDMFSKLAVAAMGFDDQLRLLCNDLTDKEMVELAQRCKDYASPQPDRTFAMPLYHYMAEIIQGELGMRIIFRRAEEHREETGSGFYCVSCDGEHTPEHLAELQADAKCKPN